MRYLPPLQPSNQLVQYFFPYFTRPFPLVWHVAMHLAPMPQAVHCCEHGAHETPLGMR
jgi:hypothetical protein